MTRAADATAAVLTANPPAFPARKRTMTLPSGLRPTSLRPFDGERVLALDAFADRFADLFARADQAKRFRAYLRGLLDGGERKNVEAIASRFAPQGNGESGFAQALQHFISHSPWDAGQVAARYRQLVRESLADPSGVWVVHDGVIPKKGRHSVGTQRQFARGLGRKVNCQVAVVVGLDGPHGYLPMAVRLYLPGYWLRENVEAVEKTVPAESRGHVTKSDVALGLLDELISEGWPATGVVADDAYGHHLGFRDGLESRGFRIPDSDGSESLIRAADGFDWLKSRLGLEHFEGRTWVGWHHHTAIVLAAFGFLFLEAAPTVKASVKSPI